MGLSLPPSGHGWLRPRGFTFPKAQETFGVRDHFAQVPALRFQFGADALFDLCMVGTLGEVPRGLAAVTRQLALNRPQGGFELRREALERGYTGVGGG